MTAAARCAWQVPSTEDLLWMLEDYLLGQKFTPETVATNCSGVDEYLAWCYRRGLQPHRAGIKDIMAYEGWLSPRYAPRSVKRRLASVRNLYEAMQWQGLCQENPVPSTNGNRRARSSGWEGLAIAIVLRAVKDVMEGNGHSRQARQWMGSEMAHYLVDELGIPPTSMDAWLAENAMEQVRV